MSQAKGMRQLLGQGQRLVASLYGLVRVAQIPQAPGRIAEAALPGVKQGTIGAMVLGIVESTHLFQMLSGQGKLSRVEQSSPQHEVGPHKQDRVADVLG